MAIQWRADEAVETTVVGASITTSVWQPVIPKRAVEALLTTSANATFHGTLAASAASAGNGYPMPSGAATVVPVGKFSESGTQTLTVKSVSGALGKVNVIFGLRDGQPQ